MTPMPLNVHFEAQELSTSPFRSRHSRVTQQIWPAYFLGDVCCAVYGKHLGAFAIFSTNKVTEELPPGNNGSDKTRLHLIRSGDAGAKPRSAAALRRPETVETCKCPQTLTFKHTFGSGGCCWAGGESVNI